MKNVVTPDGRAEIEKAWVGEFWPLLEIVSREFERHGFHLAPHHHRIEVVRDMEEIVRDSHDNLPVEFFLEDFQEKILNHPLVIQTLVASA
ncbi:MAG: hypothetical protein A2556_02855 [Candidatus Vogelbacteria bacterium RIFOXYD2_FULL_44_9]|uniref:Uncharacterized protein n=1 Tax=Candidatus Vogelbacteria bacterium RIFOXYD2_FULL_44_9 TaxID=1802441 RepID=A0A1G2QR36_9BACT|nr:MAG: hypothetical protein A2556_02855 [Candidatus Vogelbacteria bacterium RIFOXYD2_FULL_44_9]